MASEQIPLYKPTEHQTPEAKVDHNAQPGSLGVHPSEKKKKEAIVPNLLQPESPHKNLPYAWNEPESPHKNLPPELKRSNPDPNVSELPSKLKKSKKFTFEKPSEKDTDPNAPKLPDKLKESKKFTFEKPSEKDTDPSAPKLPDKLKESKKFTFEKPSEKDTDPSAPKLPDKLKESKKFTFEKPSEKDTPLVPQQVLSPAIREPQALNTTAKAPDIKPAQEPSMQQATPTITEQRSPLTAPNQPLETVQADRNQGSPILWSNNPEPQFSQNQVPLSASASGVEQPKEKVAKDAPKVEQPKEQKDASKVEQPQEQVAKDTPKVEQSADPAKAVQKETEKSQAPKPFKVAPLKTTEQMIQTKPLQTLEQSRRTQKQERSGVMLNTKPQSTFENLNNPASLSIQAKQIGQSNDGKLIADTALQNPKQFLSDSQQNLKGIKEVKPTEPADESWFEEPERQKGLAIAAAGLGTALLGLALIVSAPVSLPALIIGGAIMGAGLASARQGAQIVDGDKKAEEFSFEEVAFGAALGGVMTPIAAPVLAAVPEIGTVLAARQAVQGVGEMAQGNVATGIFDAGTAVAPLLPKGTRQAALGEETIFGANPASLATRQARFNAADEAIFGARTLKPPTGAQPAYAGAEADQAPATALTTEQKPPVVKMESTSENMPSVGKTEPIQSAPKQTETTSEKPLKLAPGLDKYAEEGLSYQISPKYLDKHLPDTAKSNSVLRQEGSNHVFNDKQTLSRVEAEILERGQYTGTARGTERYGLQFDEPIGYRIDSSGNKTPLTYGELKIFPDGRYHVIPRTGAAKL
jgi:hypothetical protein